MARNEVAAALIAAALLVLLAGRGVAQDTSLCYCPCVLYQCLPIKGATMPDCDLSCNYACGAVGLPIRLPEVVEPCGVAPPPMPAKTKAPEAAPADDQ